MKLGRALVFWACAVSLHMVVVVKASYFDVKLKPGARKCYTEELPSNALFVTEVQPRDPEEIHVSVSMRNPRVYYFNETSTQMMKTAFTVPKKGHVDVCLRNQAKKGVSTASLRMLSGALAKDFSQIAKKEHLDPVVTELRAVEALIKDYRSRQMYLVGKEASTRSLVDSTHTRVVLLAAVNVGVVVLCNLVTIIFLRAFFRAKKII